MREITEEEHAQIAALRERVADLMHPIYDTDFNLLRWLDHARHAHKHATPEKVLAHAAQGLRKHLRYRQLLGLNDEHIPDYADNEMYRNRLLPRGCLTEDVDSSNRLVLHIEYRTMQYDKAPLVHSVTTVIRNLLLTHEYCLRKIMAQEKRTGRLSGIYHTIDLSGVSTSAIIGLGDGYVAYMMHLAHNDHYPNLFMLTHLVNAARWMTVPYKASVMLLPRETVERNVMHGYDFLHALREHLTDEQIPEYLGGKRPGCRTVEQLPISQEMLDKAAEESKITEELHNITVHARRRIVMPIKMEKNGQRLSWLDKKQLVDDLIQFRVLTTDQELFFGVFRPPEGVAHNGAHTYEHEVDPTHMQWPYLRINAKHIPERGVLENCSQGTYYFVFDNRHSWISKRRVHICVKIGEKPVDKSCYEHHELVELK